MYTRAQAGEEGALWDDLAGTLSPPAQGEELPELEDPVASRDIENAPCRFDGTTLAHVVRSEQALQRYDRMNQDARDGGDVQILRAVELARQAVTQRSLGKAREDALIAEAMMKIRDDEDARRAAMRAHIRRLKQQVDAMEDARAAATAPAPAAHALPAGPLIEPALLAASCMILTASAVFI